MVTKKSWLTSRQSIRRPLIFCTLGTYMIISNLYAGQLRGSSVKPDHAEITVRAVDICYNARCMGAENSDWYRVSFKKAVTLRTGANGVETGGIEADVPDVSDRGKEIKALRFHVDQDMPMNFSSSNEDLGFSCSTKTNKALNSCKTGGPGDANCYEYDWSSDNEATNGIQTLRLADPGSAPNTGVSWRRLDTWIPVLSSDDAPYYTQLTPDSNGVLTGHYWDFNFETWLDQQEKALRDKIKRNPFDLSISGVNQNFCQKTGVDDELFYTDTEVAALGMRRWKRATSPADQLGFFDENACLSTRFSYLLPMGTDGPVFNLPFSNTYMSSGIQMTNLQVQPLPIPTNSDQYPVVSRANNSYAHGANGSSIEKKVYYVIYNLGANEGLDTFDRTSFEMRINNMDSLGYVAFRESDDGKKSCVVYANPPEIHIIETSSGSEDTASAAT